MAVIGWWGGGVVSEIFSLSSHCSINVCVREPQAAILLHLMYLSPC